MEDDVLDDDEEEQKVEEEEEEEQGGGVDVLGSVVLKRGSKLALNDNDLCTYFFNRLERMSCYSLFSLLSDTRKMLRTASSTR